jgi:hypothetical protein
MTLVRAAQERNTRNAAGLTERCDGLLTSDRITVANIAGPDKCSSLLQMHIRTATLAPSGRHPLNPLFALQAIDGGGDVGGQGSKTLLPGS